MENHLSQGKMIATSICSGEYAAFHLHTFLLSNGGNKGWNFLLVTTVYCQFYTEKTSIFIRL